MVKESYIRFVSKIVFQLLQHMYPCRREMPFIYSEVAGMFKIESSIRYTRCFIDDVSLITAALGINQILSIERSMFD